MKVGLLRFAVVAAFLAGCSDGSMEKIVTPSADESVAELQRPGLRSNAILPPPSTPTASATASVDSIFSSDGATDSVTFVGVAGNFDTAYYSLTDEYGVISASGGFTVGSVTLEMVLPTNANANDADGRLYTFTVTSVGGTVTAVASTTVVAPYIAPSNDDDDDDDGCGSGHHGRGHNKKHWKCEKCGKHNHVNKWHDYKCSHCSWKHNDNWKCAKCGKHHAQSSKKNYCNKKKGPGGRG